MGPTNPLRSSYSTDEYTAASSSSNLEGFIFVETDRLHTLPHPPFIPSEVTAHLKHALSEIEFAVGIHRHPQAGQPKLLGMVSFAPLPLGKEGMEVWASVLPEGAEEIVKGVRYLVQDKPSGTINAKRFVQGIRWVLERDWVFDLGVDLRSGGVWQLNEAVEALSAVIEGSAGTGRVVINHLGKPDLHIPPAEVRGSKKFKEWEKNLQTLAKWPIIYVKLSGVFSEVDHRSIRNIEETVKQVLPWAEVVWKLFPGRMMWASDWPVCNVGWGEISGKENMGKAWRTWRDASQKLLDQLGLTQEEKQKVWGDVAAEAYKL